MTPPLGTFRSRHLRRRMLECLRVALSAGGEGWYPARALFEFLGDELDGLTLSEIHEALNYLAGKKYVAVRDVRETRTVPAVLQGRIEPKGTDLLEGTIPVDPGIEDDRP